MGLSSSEQEPFYRHHFLMKEAVSPCDFTIFWTFASSVYALYNIRPLLPEAHDALKDNKIFPDSF
jgi:hypothetical protein